jgi:hypothetical protein
VESFGDFAQQSKADVPLPTLAAPNMRPVNPRMLGKFSWEKPSCLRLFLTLQL